jgi:uncharacterized protein
MAPDRIKLTPLWLALMAVLAAETAAGGIVSLELLPPLVALAAVRAVEIVLLVAVAVVWADGPGAIGLAPKEIGPGIRRGLIWSAGFGLLVSIAAGILALAGRNPLQMIQIQLPSDPTERFLYLFTGAVIAPVAEEIFFRGYLYGFFRRWGVLCALILSNLAFVLAHGITGLPLTQMVGGILFALCYEVEGRLMAPVTVHVLGNGALFGVGLL